MNKLIIHWKIRYNQKIESKSNNELANQHRLNSLQIKGFSKLKEYRVYKILVQEWYQYYNQNKGKLNNKIQIDEIIALKDEEYKLNIIQPNSLNKDNSLYQEIQKMEILFTDESKFLTKPISFLDDTIHSIK